MFKFSTTHVVDLKKMLEVVKDVFMEVYIEADETGLSFLQRSSEYQKDSTCTVVYCKVSSGNTDSYKFCKTIDNYGKEDCYKYSEIFQTEQLYKCVKSMTHHDSIEIVNTQKGILVQNAKKNTKHFIAYLNRQKVRISLDDLTTPQNLEMPQDLASSQDSPFRKTIYLLSKDYTSSVKNFKSLDFSHIEFKLVSKNKLILESNSNMQVSQNILTDPTSQETAEVPSVSSEPIVYQKHLVSNLILFIKSINLSKDLMLHFVPRGMFVNFYSVPLNCQMYFFSNAQ